MSACEYPASKVDSILEYIEFDDFNWIGRDSVKYKEADDISFNSIRRIELAGKNGEISAFDLRYFEMDQNGFSSKEMHQHAHVIIVARGEGEVIVGDEEYSAKKNDILYIKPMTTHQLKNPHAEPFGFYCIVDRDRDKPIIID